MTEEHRSAFQLQRPNWVRSENDRLSWPRGPRRVRDLASEPGTTQRLLPELCEALGIPARSKDTRLSEPNGTWFVGAPAPRRSGTDRLKAARIPAVAPMSAEPPVRSVAPRQ